MQILFHAGAGAGPFRVQKRDNVSASAPWYDLVDARVVELQPGVYVGYLPAGSEDLGFYRVVGEQEVIAELKGWTVRLSVSTPANGTHFVVGERAVVTVTILDVYGQGIGRSELSGLALYMDGPQDPLKTVSAVKLLNATTDRSKRPHHYIELKNDPNAVVNGNQITYELQPVTDEAPGTYVVALRASLAADGMQQIAKYTTVQIGTDTPETDVISNANCAECHLGTVSGKMYMHHVDPGRSPTGSWAIDYDPQMSCKICHNNEGYASFVGPAGTRISDHIVIRAHGVHMGEGLQYAWNRENAFEDYVPVVFPADVRNCTMCHVDDRWKTNPSRLACTSCHDNIYFGNDDVPEGMVEHTGGPWANDDTCKGCHNATKVAGYHEIDPPDFQHDVELAVSAPANEQYFVAGEAPIVTIKLKKAGTDEVIPPDQIVEPVDSQNVAPNEWRRANLFVSGPRADTRPVLTSKAAATSPSGYYANNDFRVRIDPGAEDPKITRAADSIQYQLDDVAGLAAGTYTVFVEVMPAAPLGGWAVLNFQVGTDKPEPLVAGSCLDCHQATTMHSGYFAVPFAPDTCKSCHDNERQLAGMLTWGDSNMGFGAGPLSRRIHGVHYGHYLEKPEEVHQSVDYSEVIFPQDVRNCTKCHSETNTWTSKPSRLACLACHDHDHAEFHTMLMTYDPTPDDSWSGDEQETCVVCHGSGADFAPSKVHSISNPYVPPYPREAEAE